MKAHIARLRSWSIKVCFANLENLKTMTWIVITIDWSITKPAYLFLPPRIMV